MRNPCSTCVFWATANQKVGECRFNPPTVLLEPGKFPVSRWPVTGADQWCGRWDADPEKMTGDFNIAPGDVAREQGGE